ncbi:solute carrier family 35 member F6-like [Corticium candelabrum]|uniref:solute carrier family 35 member F6-like n=1 Tax=Corticium candelabrum TaxID=121492 RepID=UPI002E261A7A|nr:solute carrier family 35 member F6-like [Corticium candelabrum]
MTYEQKFIVKYDVPPLQAVHWEGIWVSFSSVRPERLENVIDAVYQIGNSRTLIIATIGLILSISFFNFSGITVTKEMNATTCMVLDSVRTLFIWIMSLSIRWESFQPLQPVGYVLLVCGTFIYHNLVFGPLWKKIKERGANYEKEPLLFDKASGQHSGIGVN